MAPKLGKESLWLTSSGWIFSHESIGDEKNHEPHRKKNGLQISFFPHNVFCDLEVKKIVGRLE